MAYPPAVNPSTSSKPSNYPEMKKTVQAPYCMDKIKYGMARQDRTAKRPRQKRRKEGGEIQNRYEYSVASGLQ